MKALLSALILALTAFGCNSGPTGPLVSGPMIDVPGPSTTSPVRVSTEHRDVSGFNGVVFEGAGQIEIEQGGSESLTITAEDRILELLHSEVRDGRLILYPEADTDLQTWEGIHYKITVKSLESLEVSGVADLNCRNIQTDSLEIRMSGVGSITMSGHVDTQRVTLAGMANYWAENLQSRVAFVTRGGMGTAVVRVSERLVANVSGQGVVEYIGNPVVEGMVSGSGRIRRR